MSDWTKAILFMLIVFVLGGLLFPADAEARIRRVPKGEVQEHFNSWSIQLYMDRDFDNEGFRGGMLSLTKQVSRDGAMRLNIGFFEDDNHDLYEDRVFFHDGYSFVFQDMGFFDISGGSISLQYLHYPKFDDRLRFYLGAGPRVSYRETDPDLGIIYYDLPYNWVDEVRVVESGQLGLGLEGSVGMEVFLNRSLSVLAEYALTLENRWYFLDLEYYDYYGYYVNEFEAFEDGLHLDGSNIRLGVAVYF